MADQVLQADLDALARLKPDLELLAGEVKADVPGMIPAGGTVEAEAVPSLAAAQEMSTRTMPMVKLAVAGRFMKLGEMIDYARSGFLTADDQLQRVINTIPTLQPVPAHH